MTLKTLAILSPGSGCRPPSPCSRRRCSPSKIKKSKPKKIRNQNLALLLLLPTATVLHGGAHSDQESWRDAVAERVWYEHCCFKRWMFLYFEHRWEVLFCKMNVFWCFCTNHRKPWHWPSTNSSLPSEAKTLPLFKNRFDHLLFEMFDCSKRPNWSGYFWWHVIINNPSASKDLIEG